MNVKKINSEEFTNVISKGTVVVDFYAEWCGPCKMLAPVLEDLAKEVNDVLITKINVDENINKAAQFNVSGVPTLILFKDGKEVDRKIGFAAKPQLKAWIENHK